MYVAICFLFYLRRDEFFCFFMSNCFRIYSPRNIYVEVFPFQKWAKPTLSFGIRFSFICTNRRLSSFFCLNQFYSSILVDCMWIFTSWY